MSKDDITAAISENNQQVGKIVIDHGFLGDGTGTVVADQLNREAFYYQIRADGGTRIVSSATLALDSNIPFENLSNPTQQIPIDLGYTSMDSRLKILGQSGSTGIAATGGYTLIEQKISQAAHQSITDVPEWRVIPQGTEVFINAGMYIKLSTGSELRWSGGATSRASTTLTSLITALSGTGKHQLVWVCFDYENGVPFVATSTAVTPAGTLPAPNEFNTPSTNFTGISTTGYKKVIPVYLYDGQVGIDEAFIYRAWDARYELIFPGSSGSGDVVGPASAVGGDFVQFNGTSGKLIEDGGLSLTTDGTFAGNSDSLIPSEKAVKTYVDNTVNGLSPKTDLALWTNAALPTVVYANGSSGVGATLTGFATGVLTVDGVTVTAGMRIGVKDQAAGLQNGIYSCTVAGAIGVAFVLTRTTDADTSAELIGAYAFALQGTANADTAFICTNTSAITLGTTAITFGRFQGAGINQLTGDVTAGPGTGSQVATLATVTVPKGGTGQTSLTAHDLIVGNGASAVNFLTPGSAGNYPRSNGTDFVSTTIPSGDLPVLPQVFKVYVKAASTANVTISGPGSTLDGFSLTNGDRILLKNQSTPSQNGVWQFNGSAAALTRPTDFASGDTVLASYAVTFEVLAGTANIGTQWYITNTSAVTIDTTSISFQQYASSVASGAVTGTLPIGNGGTGASSLAGHGAVIMNSAGTAETSVAPGTSGHVLHSDGTDWSSQALVSGDIPNLPASIITSGQLALARGGSNADLSATGPGLVIQNANAGNLSVLTTPDFCQFRLTLTTGVPVTTSDVTAATTVYACPSGRGALISLYDGSHGWKIYKSAQFSVAVPSTLFKLFDVFAYDNSGTPAVETLDWNQTTGTITAASNATPIVITSNSHGLSVGNLVGIGGVGGNTAANGIIWRISAVTTNTFTLEGSVGNGAFSSNGTWYYIPQTRATALTMQDGVNVKSGDATRRYLGTLMTTGTSGQTEDSVTKRFLYNYYNQVERAFFKLVASSHSYTTAAFEFWNLDQANRIQFIQGLCEHAVGFSDNGQITNGTSTNAAVIGIGLDTSSAAYNSSTAGTSSNITLKSTVASFINPADIGIGYHYLSGMEFGQTGASFTNMLLSGSVMM